jgi:hypothetical protein
MTFSMSEHPRISESLHSPMPGLEAAVRPLMMTDRLRVHALRQQGEAGAKLVIQALALRLRQTAPQTGQIQVHPVGSQA